MHLKSLEIHGFKSFADRTKLEFHQGVTGIVGPNGCGKSNIVDAMRWVLGETSAKALRGGEMADVIFNGTDRRPALGMAEVTLNLSGCEGILDTEYDEVSLGRRVFRDGKGEYLINKQPCRLKDIHGLLMDTGIGRSSYSIMEQGKIDLLLSSKPEDRRAVFEEAAGITKYKTQKKEALRKLDYTEANLVRIRDVIAENERQIRSLSRQASKAKRFQSLFDDVKILDLHFSHKQWREIRAEKAELSTSIRQLRLQQDEVEDAIEQRQAQMAAARVEYQEIETRLSELQTNLSRLDNEISNANNRIEFNGERAHELSVLIRKNEDDISQAKEKLAQQLGDIAGADQQLASVDGRIQIEREKVEEYESATQQARTDRENLNQSLREIDEERSHLKSRIAGLEAGIETNQRQSQSDEQRSRQLQEEIGRLQEDECSRSRDAEDLRKRITEHQKSIEEFEENLAEMEQKYHQAKRAASDMQEDLSSLHKLHAEKQSRLEVLEQLISGGEGFAVGTQEVLKGLNDPDYYADKVKTPLSQHIEVEPSYADAIEASLGKRLQAVVVTEVEIAEKIIGALKEEQLGEASLIAQNHLSEITDLPSSGIAPLGAIGWAKDKVSVSEEALPLVGRLLHGVLLADNLNTALRLRERHPDKAVATLDGEYVSAEGIIQGGRTGDESVSILKMQNEVRELERITSSLLAEISTRQNRRDELNQRVDQLEDILQQARERLQQKRVNSSTLEGKLALVERDQTQLSNKIESLNWEKRDLDERQAKLEESLNEDERARDEAASRVGQLTEQTNSLNSKLDQARILEESLVDQVTEARTSLAVEHGAKQNLEEQRAPMVTRQIELEELIERRLNETTNYQERIQNAARETEDLQEKIEVWTEQVKKGQEEQAAILVERNNYSSRIEEGEEELTKNRRKVQEVADQRGKEEVKTAQIDIHLENLERTCRERYRTELEFFEPDSHALLAAIDERCKNTRGLDLSIHRNSDERAPEPISQGQQVEDAEREPLHSEEEVQLDDPAEPDWNLVEELVTQLRNKLDSMGPVNIDAIEEFDELEEHYKFNLQQLEDLDNSKEELLRMIARINRDTRKMFSETFEQIRKNFREMFKELFGEKAKADLLLMDDGDPLESGIDIIAKPPGKKLQSISLLSGGERSMTAVALLFGIYMVKPSPFCVLDELDAPLDEANITRFIRVLDRFIGNSQFVIVTHSKRTMSRADVMYGVSMEEFGVSKTVGVSFSSADKAKASKAAVSAVS
ncbi:MAG: chromosome segregation protein SMC [Verrucomicrobiota bacterium]